jgi:hypothetical protein
MNPKKSKKIVKLNRKHHMAIQLKYEGKSNPEIAKEVGFSVRTIETYFSIDGKLFEAYQNYEREQFETIRSEAAKVSKRNIRNAMATIVNKMSPEEEPNIQLAAAKYLVDREFGKAKEIVDANLTGDPIRALMDLYGIARKKRKNKK